MVAMSRFCAGPGCTAITPSGRFCEKCRVVEAKRQAAARPELDSWYSRAAWRGSYGARGYKLRNSPMCEIEGCGKWATDVHHKDSSWKSTGDWRSFIDQNNLQSLCHEHHSEITMKEIQNAK
jgi:hypothetical protein